MLQLSSSHRSGRRNWPCGAVVEPVKVNCECEHDVDEDRRGPHGKDTEHIEHGSNLHDYRISPGVFRPASRKSRSSEDGMEWTDIGVHPGNVRRKPGLRVGANFLDFADYCS